MNYIAELKNLSLIGVVIGFFIIIESIKYVWTAIEWIIKKTGIEFKWKKQKEMDHQKLEKVSEDFAAQGMSLSETVNKINTSLDAITNKVNSMQIQLVRLENEIDATKFASQSNLGDKINSKYKRYINLGGIPEDELEEFEQLHKAYKGVGGNHSGDEKYKYCIDKLPLIPSEVK